MAVTQKKPDHFEQLLLLRAFTKTTGMLHDAQVLQLKMWPRVVSGKKLVSKNWVCSRVRCVRMMGLIRIQ